jgi:hypothetical protein
LGFEELHELTQSTVWLMELKSQGPAYGEVFLERLA